MFGDLDRPPVAMSGKGLQQSEPAVNVLNYLFYITDCLFGMQVFMSV